MDWKKPTVQMLGRWQPWHKGHTELFKRAHAKTGQVCIMVRDVFGSSGGDGQDDNPFAFKDVKDDVIEGGEYENEAEDDEELVPKPNDDDDDEPCELLPKHINSLD